jgi:DNA polymerase III subunit delta'
MSNDILPWQTPIWNFMLSRYQQKRLPSAFLFEGANGIGKKIFSHAFAGLLFCQSNNLDKSCGKCNACHLLKSGAHPDFICISNEGLSKAIKIDQIRTLNEAVFKTTHFQEGCRVVIIEAAHHLNTAAANALLKTLEEPPRNVFFILLTDSPHRISATIRSRCERIKFSKPSIELTQAWLKNQLGSELTEQYSAEFLLRLTHYSPLEAQSLVEKKMLHWRESLISDFSKVILGHIDPLSLAEKYKALDYAALFFWIKTIVVDLIHLKMGTKERIMHIDQSALLEACVSKMNGMNLFFYLDKIYHLEEKVNEFNLNPLLVIDEIFYAAIEAK